MGFARGKRWCLCALTGALLLASPTKVGAEEPASPDRGSVSQPAAAGQAVRTAKERLAGKASDEQRLDNCKVPPDQRGAKPRPDTCARDQSSAR